ncbi:glycerol-3-phosphate 1-O-acyltransferase PlsY [Thiotrichales bacterium 19S3-7]|nr:glycerol-3-phosphate 1-O-acyltransferase PlsY [Thiotrichales bacterium 19S3-7]MCF6802750.1 glycerol-3-phosphate 1-O-acyltransferase PlsY [Thiotrichales bacterium 19S3-11]
MINSTLLLIIFAYLLGSISMAILICFLFRLPSPRTIGSGNPGATNVLRIGGKLPASLTLIGDALKGFIPVIIAKSLQLDPFIIASIGLCAILGHLFPVFFKFKGGKGVATFIGVIFAFSWILGICFIVTWLVIALISRYSSLAALIATIESPIIVYFLYGYRAMIIFSIIAIIILLRHQQNIQRLLKGTESKIGQKAKTN